MDSVTPAGRPEPRFPRFPSDAAEKAIQLISRIAGPAAFVIALGGIIWMIIK